jgi:hypothetical protein
MNRLECRTYWRELQRLHAATLEVVWRAAILLLGQGRP